MPIFSFLMSLLKTLNCYGSNILLSYVLFTVSRHLGNSLEKSPFKVTDKVSVNVQRIPLPHHQMTMLHHPS